MAATRLISKTAVVCLLFASALLNAPETLAAGELLEPSVYHAEEVSAKVGKGQPWLGLFQTKAGKYELKQTKLVVTLVNDPIVDDKPEQKTGKKISIVGMGEPIVLVRGISGLKAGRVTGNDLKKEHMPAGQTHELRLGAKVANLIVTGKKKDEDITRDYKVVLESGGVKQELYKRAELGSDGCPSLLWSGDLDGDGKIDLIMDMTDHYNVPKVTLLLSGKAKSGKLVEQVAFIEATGC